ncbi:MAG: MFS transporter [Minisyncoccia bacterium]
MNTEVKRLLAVRFLRSLGQGILVVDFSLYLKDLGYSGVFIGSIFAFASLFGAFGSIIVGIISDKTKRKPFLKGYTLLLMSASLLMFSSTNFYIIIIASILGNFGLGSNGAAGPFSPADQAWLTEKILPDERGNIFSINSALGFTGMAIGAFLAVTPTFLKSLPNFYNYRILFLFIFVNAFITYFIIESVSEEDKRQQSINYNKKEEKKEEYNLLKLILLNSLVGLSGGLRGPLIAYWFAVKFGIGAEKIAPVMAITFLITGILSFYTSFLTKFIGIINAVVVERAIGLVFLIALPLSSNYIFAFIFYLLNQTFSRGSAGARQALTVSIVGDNKRGLAVGLNAASMQIPRSIGPYITGILLNEGYFGLPFFIAAGLQGVYLLFYRKVFKNYNFPTE